jgi:hypothetical protein
LIFVVPLRHIVQLFNSPLVFKFKVNLGSGPFNRCNLFMKSNNTQCIFGAKPFSMLMLIVFLFSNLNSFSQTITDFSPVRITSGTEITVTGTGFTASSADDSNIRITNGSSTAITIPIQPGSGKFIDANTLTFEIRIAPDGNDTAGQQLTIDGVGISGPNSAKRIEYVKPTRKTYGPTSNFRITEVFTDWDYVPTGASIGKGYYRSNWYRVSNPDDTMMYNSDDPNFSSNFQDAWPNDRHNLLAFTIDGVTYSTGVKDALLDTNGDGVFDVLGASGIAYTDQIYAAYSTNGVSGIPNSANLITMGDKIDGVIGGPVLNADVDRTVRDVMIDGINGLDLGTGITNFNDEAKIQFFSGNGVFGAVGDNIPDLIITQHSRAGGNGDVYYYADIDGDIVGTPVRLKIAHELPASPILYDWRVNYYFMAAVPYPISLPTGPRGSIVYKKRFRMVGLELSDFEIDGSATGPTFPADHISNVNNITMQGGGTADVSFIAYNKGAFEIKSPKIIKIPLSRNVCIVPSSGHTLEFKSFGDVENPSNPMTAPQSVLDKEEISYQWFKGSAPLSSNSTFLLPGTITSDDLGIYRVRVENDFGAVDLPVTLSEGGTPTFWNGSAWVLPPAFINEGFSVVDDERNLIFSEDYNEPGGLEGCDCRVVRNRDVEVTIQSGNALKLYGEIIVEETITITDENGSQTLVGGEITFEDDASLVQTKPVTTNVNSGAIKMLRDATNLNTYDYIYWSSPVAGFDVGTIPGTLTYQWDPTAGNAGAPASTGNWVNASGVMQLGEGYIKRVLSADDFTTPFAGKPNNGVIDVDVFKSIAPLPALASDQHWNLIGNPYPSAINAETFLVDNTNLVGFVNLWTRGDGISNDGPVGNPFYGDFGYNYADEYITHNGTGPSISGFDGKIASGQAFFVQVLDASSDTDVTFNNTMRFDGSENAYNNDQFFRSNNADATLEKQLIWLGLINESNASSISLLGYVDGATNGVDRMYDAPRSGEGMSMYSMLEDTKMTIQGRSYPFDTNDEVALGVDLLEDGIYKIAIDHVTGSVFENETQGIYLEDTYLNVVHDLRATPYGFAGVAGTTKDRFVLRYTADQQLSIDEQQKLDTFIYVKEERLYVKSSKNIDSIVLYDLTGKQVVTYKLHENVSQSFNTSFQYPRGAYIAVINLEGNILVRKKLIN